MTKTKKGGEIIEAYENAQPPPDAPADEHQDRAASCPVQPLGKRKGLYFYITPSGEIIEVPYGQHHWRGITSIFEGKTEWLCKNFPTENGWSERKAATWLMRACAARGLFDPAHGLRGPGVWRGPGDGVILHCGDAVFHGGAWIPAGCEIDGIYYPASPPEPRPDFDAPATAEDSAFLHDFFGMWAWSNPPGATRLVHGWLMASMVCGSLSWRPHIWVSGDVGTGKTSLEKLLSAALGGARAIWRASDTTEAAIRQGLDGAARAVLLDEIEPRAGSPKTQQVVELARISSTDDQGSIARGSVQGLARGWYIRACFYFTSVIHAPLKPADKKRICVIDLDPLPLADDIGEVRRKLREGQERIRLLSPKLRARMILGWDRLMENIATYDLAMGGLGHTARHADQLGTILAAHDTALYDEPVTLDHARERIERVGIENYVADTDEVAHHDCLAHLLSTTLAVDYYGGGAERMTIGELVPKAHENQSYDSELRRNGLTTRDYNSVKYLVVARRHRGLNDIFARTDWERGAWSQLLRRLPGVLTRRTMISFAGTKERAVWIPLSLIESQWSDDID